MDIIERASQQVRSFYCGSWWSALRRTFFSKNAFPRWKRICFGTIRLHEVVSGHPRFIRANGRRFDEKSFNILTLEPAETDRREPKKEGTDERGNCERVEFEPISGTTEKVVHVNNIRAKLAETVATRSGACFFSPNIMKFLNGFHCPLYAELQPKTFKKQYSNI